MRTGTAVRIAVLSVCVLVSAYIGLWQGWRNATVDPPAPPAVCPLIRPEVFDPLVPRRGSLQSGDQNAPGMRSNYCLAESRSTVDGMRGSLWVSLGRYGRHAGHGPRCLDWVGDGALMTPLNRTNYLVALGDGAVYFLEGARSTGRIIRFSACLGTYEVIVRYEATGATDASIVESAATVAQEVLSRL